MRGQIIMLCQRVECSERLSPTQTDSHIISDLRDIEDGFVELVFSADLHLRGCYDFKLVRPQIYGDYPALVRMEFEGFVAHHPIGLVKLRNMSGSLQVFGRPAIKGRVVFSILQSTRKDENVSIN